MPEHRVLAHIAAFLIDLARFCDVVKPALVGIATFVLTLVGLATVVYLSLRAH
jgi:hypothetical protein